MLFARGPGEHAAAGDESTLRSSGIQAETQVLLRQVPIGGCGRKGQQAPFIDCFARNRDQRGGSLHLADYNGNALKSALRRRAVVGDSKCNQVRAWTLFLRRSPGEFPRVWVQRNPIRGSRIKTERQ